MQIDVPDWCWFLRCLQAAPRLAQALQGRKGFVDKLLDGADMLQGSGLQWYFKRQVRPQKGGNGAVCWELVLGRVRCASWLSFGAVHASSS